MRSYCDFDTCANGHREFDFGFAGQYPTVKVELHMQNGSPCLSAKTLGGGPRHTASMECESTKQARVTLVAVMAVEAPGAQ